MSEMVKFRAGWNVASNQGWIMIRSSSGDRRTLDFDNPAYTTTFGIDGLGGPSYNLGIRLSGRSLETLSTWSDLWACWTTVNRSGFRATGCGIGC